MCAAAGVNLAKEDDEHALGPEVKSLQTMWVDMAGNGAVRERLASAGKGGAVRAP